MRGAGVCVQTWPRSLPAQNILGPQMFPLPSLISPAPHLETSGTLEVSCSGYHYAHFIDEEIEARRWPGSPNNSSHCVGSHFQLLSHRVHKQPWRQAGEPR